MALGSRAGLGPAPRARAERGRRGRRAPSRRRARIPRSISTRETPSPRRCSALEGSRVSRGGGPRHRKRHLDTHAPGRPSRVRGVTTGGCRGDDLGAMPAVLPYVARACHRLIPRVSCMRLEGSFASADGRSTEPTHAPSLGTLWGSNARFRVPTTMYHHDGLRAFSRAASCSSRASDDRPARRRRGGWRSTSIAARRARRGRSAPMSVLRRASRSRFADVALGVVFRRFPSPTAPRQFLERVILRARGRGCAMADAMVIASDDELRDHARG